MKIAAVIEKKNRKLLINIILLITYVKDFYSIEALMPVNVVLPFVESICSEMCRYRNAA